jgi:uncharacterized SAM-binding protein YcdF (DUF218 family)
MTLGALGLAYSMSGDLYEYQDSVDGVHLPEVDAIVCLAGGRGRISAAGDIWYRYWELAHSPLVGTDRRPIPDEVPILYLSGMGKGAGWNALKKQLRRGVLEVIRPENALIEAESFNTESNARYLARFAKARGWERVLLMTSPYHMKRSRLIFDQVLKDEGVSLEIETLSVFQEPFEPSEWKTSLHGIRVTVTEFLKLVYYKNFWTP